jgi:flagellar biosynthesis/type III secretory pathway chaperone
MTDLPGWRDEPMEMEWTSETVREEITRLRERAAELEVKCQRLTVMNDRLRDILEIYLHADNRARRMVDSL